MTWLRIDDKTSDHPLVSRLSDGAYRLWVNSMIYCGRHLTNGHVPAETPYGLLPRRRVKPLIEELLEVAGPYGSLWEIDAHLGGYRVVHYLRWNHSREELEQTRDSAKARKEEWLAHRQSRRAPEETEDLLAVEAELWAAEDEARHPVEGRRSPSRPARPARRPPEPRPRAVAGAGGPAPERTSVSEPVPPRTQERVPNSVQSDPIPDPDPDPDPRSPTGVCALDPRVPAHASPGEPTHSTGWGEELQQDRTGDDAPSPPAPAGAGDTPPRTPPEDAAVGTDPDAVAILADLRAMPEPMCHLATPEHASRFAGARMSGLTLAEIRTAIASAGLKLGRHRAAHPSQPETLDALADHVGGFVGNQRRLTARVAPRPARDVDAVAVEDLLHRWCAAYQGTEGIVYTVTDEDRGYAADLLDLAHQAAVREGVRTGREDPGLEGRVVEHWLRTYLADEGPNGYLAKSRHPLRYIKRQLGTYGLPRKAKLAKCPAPEPEEVPATLQEHVAGIEQVLRAVGGGIGAGGDGVGSLPVRHRGPDPEAS